MPAGGRRARRTRHASWRARSTARSRSIYGGGALGGVAAYRWKCDVNENAKAPAFWHQYPELDHNEICGWGQHGDVTRQLITLVELRHGFEHERLEPRFDATREIIDECVHQVLSVEAEGEGRLAQLLDLMYLGDWVSCYLALAERRRPRSDRRDLRSEVAPRQAERRTCPQFSSMACRTRRGSGIGVRSHLSRTDVVVPNAARLRRAGAAGFEPTKDGYVDWLVEQLEAIGEPVDLVGHDWGSLLVQRVVSVRPDLIRTWCGGCAVRSTATYVWHDMAQMWQTPEVGEQVMEAMTGDALADALAEAVGRGTRSRSASTSTTR